jgi:hypothetical protein
MHNLKILAGSFTLPRYSMNNFITQKLATNGLLGLLSLFILFHLFIITGVIPFEIVWGGRLKNYSQMLSFEAISITANVIMLAVVSINAGILKVKINRAIIKAVFWAMFILFLLNTLGNLLSLNQLEKVLFTPVTLLLSLFSLRLAISKQPKIVLGTQA